MSLNRPRNRFPLDVRSGHDVWVVQADIDTETCSDYRGLLKQFRYADGLRDNSICETSTYTDAEALAALLSSGEITYACIGWLLFSPAFVNAGRRQGMAPQEYADYLYNLCQKVNSEIGYRGAWMEAYGEVGMGVIWPSERVFNKAEALEYFRNWFTTGKVYGHQWHQRVDEDIVSFYKDAKLRNENLRELPIYYTDSMMYVLQEAYRFGFPLVCYESQCATMESTQTGIAFVRGGAKMYDAWWGVDFSPWAISLQGRKIETDSVGNWRQGVTADMQYRAWVAAYMSGCNTLLHEDSYCLFYARPTEHIVIPSDLGHQAMKFYALTKTRLADRGTPVVPFAVMLEEGHGYGTECQLYWRDDKSDEIGVTGSDNADINLYVWHAKVEPTRGDYALSRLIRHALWPIPDGVWKSIGADEYPDRLKKDLDWDTAPSQQELHVGHHDVRDCSRFVANSRWADCFDVVMETAPVEKLSEHYEVIILGGAFRAHGPAWRRLRQFLQGGGTLVGCVEQVSSEVLQELGVELKGDTHPVRADGEVLEIHPVRSEKCDVIYRSDDESPLVLQKKIGGGQFFLMVFTDGMTAGGERMSVYFDRIVDRLYNETVGVTHDGEGIQLLVNQREEDTVVTLINHTSGDWRGKVEVSREDRPQISQVREVISDDAYPDHLVQKTADSVSVSARVAAYGIRMISLGPVRERAPEISLRDMQTQKERDAQLDAIRRQGARQVLGIARTSEREARR